MPHDLNLRLGGDMARKWGIDVGKNAADSSGAISNDIPDASLKGTQQVKSAKKPSTSSKISKKTQSADINLWDALPEPSAMTGRKVFVSVRLDAEIIEFFKASGSGYQTRINAVLSHYVRTCRARP